MHTLNALNKRCTVSLMTFETSKVSELDPLLAIGHHRHREANHFYGLDLPKSHLN